MRAIWIALPLLMGVAPLAAQTPGDSRARQAHLRADSIKRAREAIADSIRRRNPSDARRLREDAQRIREQRADSIRRRIQPNRLEPVPVPAARLATSRRLDSVAARIAARPMPDPPRELATPPEPPTPPATRAISRPEARPSSPPATALSSAADLRAPNRIRAAVMRMRDRSESPSFCRTGAGHPVYGRDWCWERGFRLGDQWERDRGGRVRLEPPERRPIDRRVLAEMLDPAIMKRLEEVGTGLGLTAPLNASWTETSVGGRVLTIRAGGTTIAEFSDRNRDGRADALWFRTVR